MTRDSSSDPLCLPGGVLVSDDKVSNEVVQTRLGNGLEVVIIPDHRAPVVTHMVWYRNGSADDPAGKSGIAHFLEHLMFKGTAKYPAGAFSTLVAGLGGQQNAFTSRDFTAYYQQIPREHLALCMEFEADRMRNIVLTDEVVAPERSVVLEERAMRVESSPAEILREAVQAAIFTTHPYGRPVIGWREDIEGLDRGDALAFYRRFYTPENATLIVAGDIEPAAAIELASQLYGAVAGQGTPPKRDRPREPKPTTHRQVTLVDPKVAQPQFQRSYLVPSYGNAGPGEAEALDVLAFVLGRSQTGVFFKKLMIEANIASGVHVSYAGVALENTALTIAAIPGPGISLDRLDHAIEAVIVECVRTGFDPADIERAKRRIVANAIYARDSQMALGQYYGNVLCTGMTVDQIKSWPARVAAVTSANVMDALRRLDKKYCVSGYLQHSEHSAVSSAAA